MRSNSPQPKEVYKHRNGGVYRVLMLANVNSGNARYVPTVVYQSLANNNVWTRPVSDWDRSFTQVTLYKLVDESNNTIDELYGLTIQQAESKLPDLLNEGAAAYMMEDK